MSILGEDTPAVRGGHVLAEASGGRPEVVLIADGGEEPVALRAREILEAEGSPTRVVSMPCPARFERQGREYRERVLPREAVVRVSVGAGASLGWYALAGQAGAPVGLAGAGLAAPYQTLYEQVAFAAERVAAQARQGLAKARDRAA
ncbi:transketolase-like TK C-terminal-containing protein [Kitasatospora sp. NPDC051853]|uniref:transketolase-like TK C-terminal-containing protein n=1 Tax=Kitasatospora sp. NPDC051853 TaxID=3364058 RepID=UPI00379D2DF0